MNINDTSALCYIQEQTSFMEDYKSFGYEVHPSEHGFQNRFYITFNAVLQSFGVKNRNGREYDANNIMERIEKDDYIQDQLRKNSWMGEIDHPAPQLEGEKLTMQRIGNPDLTRTSHYIRRPHLNGNLLEAPIQTDSSNEHGMNMAIKIVDGKIIPCFSARVLGSLKNIMGKAVVYVNRLICYDWVLYPSHPEAEARITQPVMESVSTAEKAAGVKFIPFRELAQMAANDSKEAAWLCESFGLSIDNVFGVTESGNSIVIAENSNIYVQPISDKFVRAKTQNILKDWINK